MFNLLSISSSSSSASSSSSSPVKSLIFLLHWLASLSSIYYELKSSSFFSSVHIYLLFFLGCDSVFTVEDIIERRADEFVYWQSSSVLAEGDITMKLGLWDYPIWIYCIYWLSLVEYIPLLIWFLVAVSKKLGFPLNC